MNKIYQNEVKGQRCILYIKEKKKYYENNYTKRS